jgi:hypothetical protein
MLPPLIVILFVLLLQPALVEAQQVSAQQQSPVGQLINRVDQPSAWQAPTNFNGVSNQPLPNQFGSNQVGSNQFGQGQSTQAFTGSSNGSGTASWMAPQYPTQIQTGPVQEAPSGFAGMSSAGFPNNQGAQPQQLMQVNGQPTLRALLPGLFNRAPAQPAAQSPTQAPTGNPFTIQNMMKAFMGGGDAPKDPQQALSQAREDLQTARDQCSQARGDASSVNGTRERDSKQSYAESARYHAQSAREAADRAYSCAQSSGSSAVNDIASQARAAADEAQAAADRATANASGGGW